MKPIIEVDGLGVEFYRARRRRMSLREMVLQGRSSSPSETFWALKDVSFTVEPGRPSVSSAPTAVARAPCSR